MTVATVDGVTIDIIEGARVRYAKGRYVEAVRTAVVDLTGAGQITAGSSSQDPLPPFAAHHSPLPPAAQPPSHFPGPSPPATPGAAHALPPRARLAVHGLRRVPRVGRRV